MYRDTLTPLERFAAYGRGEAVDRLPCVPIIGNTAARVIGAQVRDLRGNAELLADAQIAAWKRFGYDNIRVFTDLYVLAEAMGARVICPEDETAYLSRPAIQGAAALDSLSPADPLRDGLLPVHLEAVRRTVDALGKQVPVTAAVTGPFTTASFLVGAETLGRLMIKDPDSVHRLCRLALETAMRFAEMVLAAGAVPSLTEPMASCTVISPRQFDLFAAPYLKILVDAVHARGKSVTLHICGKTAGIWQAMTATGADCLSLDNEVSLTDARQCVGHRVRLMGNVHPTAVLLDGKPADVRRAVRDCVRQAHTSPKGLVVASGCSLATETPFANIDAMMDEVRQIGWPVSESRLEAAP